MQNVQDYRYQHHKIGGHGVVYEASDADTSGATYQYFGFLSIEGAWIIQRFDLSTSNIVLYRYSAGSTAYATAWTNRASLSYELYHEALT